MPAKNSISNYHGRHRFLSESLWRKYVKETESDISYADFRKIVIASMDELRKWVLKEPVGFQMSPRIGNIAINRFKPEHGSFKAFHYTKERRIPNYNLHTGGAVFKIQWFHASSTHKSRNPYWFFKASRVFNRSLAFLLKSGKSPSYNSYMQNHFINNSPR